MGKIGSFLLGRQLGKKKSDTPAATATPVAPQVTDQGVRDAQDSARASLMSAFADTRLSDPKLLNQKRTALGAWL